MVYIDSEIPTAVLRDHRKPCPNLDAYFSPPNAPCYSRTNWEQLFFFGGGRSVFNPENKRVTVYSDSALPTTALRNPSNCGQRRIDVNRDAFVFEVEDRAQPPPKNNCSQLVRE